MKVLTPRSFDNKTAFILFLLLLPIFVSPQIIQSQSIVFLDAEEFLIQMNFAVIEVLIDVRTAEEYHKERIYNALLASDKEELFAITDTLDLEQPLFVYCEEESRSKTACEILIKMGFKNVYGLKGGIVDWKRKGFDTDRSRIKHKTKE